MAPITLCLSCNVESKGNEKAMKPTALEGGVKVLDSAKERGISYTVHMH